MKAAIATFALSLSLLTSATAFAKNGKDKPDALLPRGSQAWFAVETAEHEVRALLADARISESGVAAIDVDLTTAATSEVTVVGTGSVNPIADSCSMQDHWSHHGTILKKEVYCGNAPYYAPETRPSRGSDAWALVEGIEHSVRKEAALDKSILENVVGATAELEGSSQVRVSIGYAGGSSRVYLCSRVKQGLKFDLRCNAQ